VPACYYLPNMQIEDKYKHRNKPFKTIAWSQYVFLVLQYILCIVRICLIMSLYWLHIVHKYCIIIMCMQFCDDKTHSCIYCFSQHQKRSFVKSISFGYYGVHRDNDISIFIHHCKYITINVCTVSLLTTFCDCIVVLTAKDCIFIK